MLVSINSTEITTGEIRITATNLETILLADDLFQKIDENNEEEVTLMLPIWGTRNTSTSSASHSVLPRTRRASEK